MAGKFELISTSRLYQLHLACCMSWSSSYESEQTSHTVSLCSVAIFCSMTCSTSPYLMAATASATVLNTLTSSSFDFSSESGSGALPGSESMSFQPGRARSSRSRTCGARPTKRTSVRSPAYLRSSLKNWKACQYSKTVKRKRWLTS